jgi:hypothetical protein
MVLGHRTTRPEGSLEARDHNAGIDLGRTLQPFLAQRRRASLRNFRELIDDPRVAALTDEMETVARRWFGAGPNADRANFLRMTEMQSLEFAQAEARRLQARGERARERLT